MLIIGNLEISWFAVFTSLACFIGVCIACLLRYFQRRNVNDIFTCVSFGIPLGLIFGRIFYIIFGRSNLTGLGQYLNLTNGGFGLYGVFLGVFLAAVIAVRFFDADNLGSLLDCLAVGGAFAVTVGRFATGFTPAEIGYEVDFSLFAVYDSEQGIYNLAIYQLDGIYETFIFLISIWFFVRCIRNADREIIAGKTAMLMLALHGTNQVVMDSMRADPLKLSLNEFIKISQIIGILCCVAVLVYLIIVTARKSGFSRFHWASLPLIVVAVILGVFGEYRVGSSNYISNHLIMFAGMVILDWLTIEFSLKSVELADDASDEDESDEDESYEDEEEPAEGQESQEVSAPTVAEPVEKPAPKKAAPVISAAAQPAKPTPAPKTNAPSPTPKASSGVQAAPIQKKAAVVSGSSAHSMIKTIPVISVDAPATSPATASKKKAAAPAKTVSAKKQVSAVPKVVSVKSSNPSPAGKTTEKTDAKPMGQQELNMNLIISELDKIDN